MLDKLIKDVQAVRHSPVRVARTLQPYLEYSGLLTVAQMRANPRNYQQHILHAEPGLSIVSLVWLPGQATCIHDHLAWCVVGTYLGEEVETRFDLVDNLALVPAATVRNPAGTVTHLEPPGDIHLVENATRNKVISVHVYGTDVSARGSSIRRRYHLPIRPAPARSGKIGGWSPA